MNGWRSRRWLVGYAAAAVATATVAGCRGKDVPSPHEAPPPAGQQASVVRASTPPADTAPTQRDTLYKRASAPLSYDTVGQNALKPTIITAEMIADGSRVYHGKGMGGASCSLCHGDAGQGTQNGPNLRTGNWIHISGQYQTIINVVKSGVAKPVRFSGVMPPLGAGALTEQEIRDVAAYVYQLAPEKLRRTG